MIECKPPEQVDLKAEDKVVFLAGSIEMGVAEDWQAQVVSALGGQKGFIFNPRRDNWDSSWIQSKDNPQFREQVEWELRYQDEADILVIYFSPGTKSPITLLELGLAIPGGYTRQKVVVCCPEGFWRKGNVDIVCERFGILQVYSLEQIVTYIQSAW